MLNYLFSGVGGSKLYGTYSDASDTDLLSVFRPDIKEVVLGNFAKNITLKTNTSLGQKNGPQDVDNTAYAIHQFMHLLLQGQTVAMDMLHCPEDLSVVYTPEWRLLYKHRNAFYTKNMQAFIGYAKGMSLKYNERADKLNVFEQVLDFFSQYNPDTILYDIWDYLPINANCKKVEIDANRNAKNKWCYEVCGKKLQGFATVGYASEVLQLQIDNYGDRVKKAVETGGCDFKALHHAFRVVYELQEIVETHDLKFPLRDAEFLKLIKYGKLDPLKTGLFTMLEDLTTEVADKMRVSDLPDKPDRKFAEDFILGLYSL